MKKTKKITNKQKARQEAESWIVPDYKNLKIKSKKDVISIFTSMVGKVFTKGSGLRGVDLKIFTGPTLEILGENALKMVCIALNIPFDSINQNYLKHSEYDNLRLDDHLIINSKIPIMQEDRAWIDKPFASLKWSVIQDIMILPHGKENVIDDVIFPLLCYSYDVTPKTLNTRNYIFETVLESQNINSKTSYGCNRIKLFNLSGNKRNSRGDYFSKGYSAEEIEKYINYIYNHMELYKNKKLKI